MSRWHLNIWVLMSSAMWVLGYVQPIAAQVVGDPTLPAAEQTQVTGNPNFQIDGGARRGNNLFHSFQSFSVPTGGSAYFNNAADVQNIFSRITGASVSNIDGLIRANGSANLFVLNPNGILFGPNASLNIGGSFMASTANAISFPNGEVFSSDATQPLPSQLLTVNPNALFFNQVTPQPVINQSTFNRTGLQVLPRQNLLLVGGQIQLDGGQAISPGSYVELGAVGGVGTIGLSTANEDWQLTIPNGVPRADVFLRNVGQFDIQNPLSARVFGGIIVIGDSGSIRIMGHNIDLLNSSLWVEIPSGSRLPNTRTGDIDLNATGSIKISDSVLDTLLNGQGTLGSINLTAGDRVSLEGSYVVNSVGVNGVGNAGNINITTGSLSLTRPSYLNASTYGQGNAGSVNINARDTVSFDSNGSLRGKGSQVINVVGQNAVGNAGNINITTESLSLINVTLSSTTAGKGDAGNININARDRISLTRSAGLVSNTVGPGNAGSVNINADDTVSFDDSIVYNNSITLRNTTTGKIGGINITAGSLSLTGGSILQSSTSEQTDAGNVNINARDRVSLDGTSLTGRSYLPSSIITQVNSRGVGQGGNVSITTGTLSLTNGGAINTNNDGGRGNSGRVTIQARDIQISGTAPSYTDIFGNSYDFPSGVITSVKSGAVGNGGNIIISTGSLSVSNQGRINSTAQGRGNAGNIQIQASDAVSFDGAEATSTLSTTGVGRGGDIDITARSLSLLNGAQLSASTSGKGTAGNITLNLPTGILNIQNQAEVTVSSFGSGSAGSLFVDANQIYLNNQGRIRADTNGGGGNINLRSPMILLRNGSNITTNATGSNIPGGNIGIDTRFLVAVKSEDSNISANSEDFRGGNVSINAYSIFGIQPRPQPTPSSDITATGATSALNGTIFVTTAGIEPTAGIVALPTEFYDLSRLIATSCPVYEGNSFIITGRGGLPPTPLQQLDDDADWQDLRMLTVTQQTPSAPQIRTSHTSSPKSHTAIIEATGWQKTPTGEVILVATTPDSMIQHPLKEPVNCQGLQ